MDNTLIINALSYDLASDMHEVWRLNRKRSDGSYEPRIKKSMDETWNLKHGTDEVDIANCTFEDLPSNWQYENLEASRVALNLVYDKVLSNEYISDVELNHMASVIHEEWLKRNMWVYDLNYGNPMLAVPYEKLSIEEQEKDKAQLVPAIEKLKLYKDGKIDIDELCDKYGIITFEKTI